MTDWNKIETDIKTDTNDWDRFSFCVEQGSHAYVNIFVEKGRKYKIPVLISKAVAYLLLATPIPTIMASVSQFKWNKSDDTSTL
jgi:hypothetical protein